MKNDQLIKMVNDITSFFASDPDREESINGIHGHISRFWNIKMREAIKQHVNDGGEGVPEIAVEAIRRLK